MKLKPWIAAARLRTLPLAFSSIILGTCLAASNGHYNTLIFVLSLITTLCYQVLSNYANDYGDGVKGSDANRTGEQRAVASGWITSGQMRNAVIVFAVLSFLFGTWLSIIATHNLPLMVTLTFVGLGILAIVAAITYTMGRRAYGYKGLGDISVLIFFGYVGVVGSYFLQTNFLNWEVFLPATAVGFLAMGVLNLNNMRDIEEDRKNGKRTLAVMMGLQGAKYYHGALLILAMDLAFIYNAITPGGFWRNLYFLCIPLILLNLYRAVKANDPKDFEPLLKMLALTTLLFTLLFGVGQLYS
ncbi:MAG: 1,4-dihydroxy-2-naphthoate octaprenyltransferase [Owenweeksia sp.]|nr:1,4-dihydroxy-2-naphthoate octaprenyltransferase [Owenweeksia sp.]MBF98818.1 1,4-dihydroxy-2-naphthoate octaprenyltransferase [Owenweeksia sp.]HBF18815.1 1,4-dihydroxy-2-naphthoate octaprenyltransferase [Cryomorphaceae bacterium]HCQ16939.1 1,4-dihydroxy-2-naphthoate octaprenyltransferase [Cryomorphaceae bacterium]|tara:strand:- start:3261 stop:4160 length:900 start_codon:yes stop_codon:yes gene_type:complete